MRFDVPFLPENDYVGFLLRNRKHLNSVYFSLHRTEIPDARHRFRTLEPDALIRALQPLTGVPKFGLLNSRMHHPEVYLDSEGVSRAAAALQRLRQREVLDGIVFSDAYFLQALSDAAPEVARGLQAVASINFLIDRVSKLRSILGVIADTEFRPPGKIILDRSLNRTPDILKSMVSWCRREQPQLQIALLANEGCLYQCPFKLTHDSLIACSYLDLHVDAHAINQAFGCIRTLRRNPETLFQSPFIRPEDVRHYEGIADSLKLCGRTLGPRFLQRLVGAYIDGRYCGNLLDLLDAPSWMADEFSIANDRLPPDFHRKLAACTGDCPQCRTCRRLRETYMALQEGGIRARYCR